MMILC